MPIADLGYGILGKADKDPDGDYNEQEQVRFVGCPATELLSGTEIAGELETLREFRDRDLLATTAGSRYVGLLDRHSVEVTRLLLEHEDLRHFSGRTLFEGLERVGREAGANERARRGARRARRRTRE